MKFVVIFTIITALQVSAGVYSQSSNITLKMKDVSLVQVLHAIENQTELTFLYSDEKAKEIKGLELNFEKAALKDVMDKCLKGTGLAYNLVDNTVVIIPKKNAGNTGDQKKQDKKKVKGKVVDVKGNPLPGVSVIIKGTSVGVSTDSKGKFILELPKDEKGLTLIFSFIGMEKKEIKLKDQKDKKDLKVVLKDKKEELEEVLVNGFKSVKKEHFTGNATVVTKKDILKTNPNNVVAAIQIFDPSFRLKDNVNWGSDPNSIPDITLRGESSIAMKKGVDAELMKQNQRTNLKDNPNLPIFMLDGFEVSVQKIYDMDMNRIESMTILKDAAATSLYGSRAANGVIVVTTKAPKSGEIRVNYTMTANLQLPDLSDYNLCNSKEKLEAEVAAGLFSGGTSGYSKLTAKESYYKKLKLLSQGIDSDWLAQPLEDVLNFRNSFYIEGGSGSIRYGIELSCSENDGVMKGSYRDKRGVGFHFSYNYGNLLINNRINYNEVKSENSPYGNFSDYARMQPYERLYGENGKLSASSFTTNPLLCEFYDSYDGRGKSKTITENLEIIYTILDGLKIRTQIGATQLRTNSKSFDDPGLASMYVPDNEKGELRESLSESTLLNMKLLLTYSKNIGKHFINGVGGFEIKDDVSTFTNSVYNGFQSGNLTSSAFASVQKHKTSKVNEQKRLAGFILSANYSYDNTYLLDLSLRYDGSSQFGAEKRFAPFWSVGTGINLHKFDFIKSSGFINTFKLRVSYGGLGKVNFPSYTAITTYLMNTERWYKTGSICKLQALGNEDLKWETTNTLDYGFNLALFNGRINLNASAYIKTTKDLISDLYLRHTSGFNSYKINSGEVENKGYEVSLNAVVVRTNNLIASVFANLGSNENKITKLSEAIEKYNQEINDFYYENVYEYKALRSKPLQRYYVGASTTSIYAMKSEGIDPSNGKERFIKKNGTSTYTWCSDDQVVVGNTSPDAQGSFGLNIGYKGFFINTSFLYQWGGQMYNSTVRDRIENVDIANKNVDKRVVTQRWRKSGDITPYNNITKNKVIYPTSRYVQDNDYISFNSLSFGYDFKKKFLKRCGLSKLGLKFNMNDIKRWSTIKVERGLNYPFARNYSMVLNVSF